MKQGQREREGEVKLNVSCMKNSSTEMKTASFVEPHNLHKKKREKPEKHLRKTRTKSERRQRKRGRIGECGKLKLGYYSLIE